MSFSLNSKSLKFVLLIFLLSNISLLAQNLKKYSYSKRLIGIDILIHLYGNSELKAQKAAKAAFEKIEALKMVFSDYEAESEIRQLSDYQVGQPVKISQELMQVLSLSEKLHCESHGAFDPSLRPLSIIWRQARFSKRKPAPFLIQKALERVGLQDLKLNPATSEVTFQKPSMSLDCGAIAKGAMLDTAYLILKNHDHPIAVIDAGGDMIIGAAPPSQNGWIINIEGLGNKRLNLENCSIATSGDRYQNLILDGHRYSHIIDPRTGQALKDSHQVTVIAPFAALADGLASTLSLMPPKDALTFISNYASCEALLLKERDETTTWQSPGFHSFIP